jgi:hypothetical protein
VFLSEPRAGERPLRPWAATIIGLVVAALIVLVGLYVEAQTAIQGNVGLASILIAVFVVLLAVDLRPRR